MLLDNRKLNFSGEAFLEVSWTFDDKIICCLLYSQKVTRQCQKNWDGEDKDTKSFFVSSLARFSVFLLPLDSSFHCIVNSGKTINPEKRHTKSDSESERLQLFPSMTIELKFTLELCSFQFVSRSKSLSFLE